MSRDDQFAGFAKKLLDELLSIQGVYIDTMQEDWRAWWEETIAQRAYDLVTHTMKYLDDHPSREDCLSHPDEPISYIPDMTEWPEETNK